MMGLSKIYFGILALTLAFTSQACSALPTPAPVAAKSATNQSSAVKSESSPRPTAETQNILLAQTQTVENTPTPTADAVTVTVVNGDLSIRTGPDLSFDAIAKLQDGETVTVLARSIMDGWVQIEIPSRAGETGWISIQTNYSIVTGNLLDLPRIDAVEWNVGSYLINCTPHQMIVKPGNTILQPQSRVWFMPGTYSVYDLDVDGQPVAANLTVLEHSEYNIRKDGTRKQWTCQ
jgi:hypothetical protein